MIRPLTRGVALAFAGTLALIMSASPALGATGNLSNVQVADRHIEFAFDADDATGGIEAQSVVVTVDGTTIDSKAEAASANSSVRRTAMLVVDTSGSMNDNQRLQGAKQAAEAFLESIPDDVEVGLVTFANKARLVARPTTDHEAVSREVNQLTAAGSTAIYDGVVLATRVLGNAGLRNIVLLTDGVPEGGKAKAGDATSALRQSDVRLDAVAFQTAQGRAPLKQLTDAAHGEVFSSGTSAELAAQFQAAGERLSRQLIVTADVPPDGPTGQVTLTVSGTVDGETVTDKTVALIGRSTPNSPSPIDAAPVPIDVGSGPLLNKNLIFIAAAAVFLGLVGVLAFALDGAIPNKKPTVSKQLAFYSVTQDKAKEQRRESTAFGDSAVAQTAVEFAGRLASQRNFEQWLGRKLDAAGMKLKPAEWILLQAVIVFLLPLFAFVISGRSILLTVIAIVVAFARGFVMLNIRESRRRKKFEDGLADTLQLMAGSLSAGYSLPQAADSVVREGQDPISTEFNRALVETRLGVPVEDALETVADRMRSKDWAWVVMAIRIQREVGGNLAELLVTVATTLRERARLRRQVQTLSAEGRLSAWILGALPVVFALYLLAARPSYILTLTHELLGWIMIVCGVIAMTIGALWMKKIVDVEV